jgi:hypothetical protein
VRLRLLIAVLALGVTAPSHAQEVSAGMDQTAHEPASHQPPRDEVERLWREGRAALLRHDRALALELLGKAWSLRKTHDIAANLAQAEYELERYPEAAEHLAYAIRHAPAETHDRGRVKRIQEAFARVKNKVVTLQIGVQPGAAEVFLNGRSIGIAAALEPEVFANPGAIELRATLEGHVTWTKKLHASAGEIRAVRGELTRRANAATEPSRSGIDTNEESKGSAPLTQEVDGPRADWTPVIVSASASVAALALGAGFWIWSDSKSSHAEEKLRTLEGGAPCNPNTPFESRCSEIADEDESADTLRALAYGAGVAALAGAVVTYVLWPRSDRSGSTTLAKPLVTPSAIGVSFDATF